MQDAKMIDEYGVNYRKAAIKAAKDLRYSNDVVCKIKKAKTVGEISRIMATAREADID